MSTQPTTIRLDDEEWDAVQQRLRYIDGLIPAIEQDFVHRISAQQFDELRCYLGGITEAQRTITELLLGGVVDTSRHPANGNPDRITTCTPCADELGTVADPTQDCAVCETDAANPHGIAITDEVVAARTVDGKPTWYQHNIAADRLAAQLQRGLITRGEFEAAMAVLNAQGASDDV